VKRVVSVSLGSSKRDVSETITILGQEVELLRRVVDGDLSKAAATIRELDGEVDAIGLGGIDLHLYLGKRRYTLKDALKLARVAKTTPVVDGSGLKNSLEKQVVRSYAEALGWKGKRVLMVAAVDRFGMAEALYQTGADVRYGDLIFLLGLPLPIRSLTTLHALAYSLLPVFTRLPIRWLYPMGSKQDVDEKNGFAHFYDRADIVAGDWHLIRRYLPPRVDGKVFLTNTTTRENVELLRARGAKTLVTTTPRVGGRSLATNLLEAALVAVHGAVPTPPQMEALVEAAGLEGDVLDLEALRPER